MLNDYEQNLLDMLTVKFKTGGHHYEFDIPPSNEEFDKLLDALEHLDAKGLIMLHESPRRGSKSIFVEEFPPCCMVTPGIVD